jgi:hypothetical protein
MKVTALDISSHPVLQINGQCLSSRIGSTSSSWPSPAYGGPCDQFGALCRMWEVVDFLEVEPGATWMQDALCLLCTVFRLDLLSVVVHNAACQQYNHVLDSANLHHDTCCSVVLQHSRHVSI